MILTQLAVILVGIYLVITSQQPASSTLTLVWGIAVVLLVVFDLAPLRARWGRVP